ncbi:hypothetical protein V6N13_077252 [Hibiscus sabdariffa]|uniref:6-phosphogluconate dehydrogenase NADP-binding domain-containing protein n=1 Tax=Hibiscus sabdariffa TaxID=183260 RepID=A0ABR2CQM7_9ROSI
MEASTALSRIGLAVMGQNLALNVAEKGFPISVYNRTTSKVPKMKANSHCSATTPLGISFFLSNGPDL